MSHLLKDREWSGVLASLRYSEALGQAARLKREFVGIDPRHREPSRVFFRQAIQTEEHSRATSRNNCE